MSRLRLDTLPAPVLICAAALCLLALGVYACCTSLVASNFPTTLAARATPVGETTEHREWVLQPVDLGLVKDSEAPDEPNREPAAARWHLVAVELSATGSLAFLDLGEGAELRALRVGDELDGQQVVGIEPRGVRWQNRRDQTEWFLPLQEASS
jgi:hypothetical protein